MKLLIDTKNTIGVVLFIFFSLTTCKSSLSKDKLAKYINDPDNGVSIEKKVNGTSVKITFRPSDFLVLQEIGDSVKFKNNKIKILKEKYSKQMYFVLSISRNDQEILNGMAVDRTQFGDMVNQFAFNMHNNVLLISSKNDTIDLLDFVYPRMYGMTTSTDILFAFKKPKLENIEWLRFVLKDPGVKTGDINFKFLAKDIRKTPGLKF